MSISNLRVGESTLTGQGRSHLTIRFLHFFLYNSCQFPDFKLLCNETRRNVDVEALSLRLSMAPRQLRSFFASLSLVEAQLRSLSSLPILQVLFILGPNVHKPLRVVLLNFQDCDIDHSIEEDTNDTGSSLSDECFPVFFRNLMQCPQYAAMFGRSLQPSRLHVYFKSKKGLRCSDCIPKVDFRPPFRDVHIINVLSMEDTMELSTVVEPNSNTDRSGYDKEDNDNLACQLMATHEDEVWFACSKVIPGCQ